MTSVAISGCSTAAEAPVTTAATTTMSATPTSTPTTTPTLPLTPAAPEASVSTETTITIMVNGAPVTAVLQNNAATASLVAQLPLELSFEDYGGQEKIGGIPAPLNVGQMPPGGSAEPGTLGYYSPDQAIVLYYDSVGYYEGIIPLGTFDDIAAVRDAPAFVGTITAN